MSIGVKVAKGDRRSSFTLMDIMNTSLPSFCLRAVLSLSLDTCKHQAHLKRSVPAKRSDLSGVLPKKGDANDIKG